MQRVLWASTSTKNPAYPDTLYVAELIGPHTVNTMPPATLEAFRDHGVVRGSTILDSPETAAAEIAGSGEGWRRVSMPSPTSCKLTAWIRSPSPSKI